MFSNTQASVVQDAFLSRPQNTIVPPRTAEELHADFVRRQLRQQPSQAVNVEDLWKALPEASRAQFMASERQDRLRYWEEVEAQLRLVNEGQPETLPMSVCWACEIFRALLLTCSFGRQGKRAMFNLPGNPLVFVGGDDCRIQAWDTEVPLRSYILAQPCTHQQVPGMGSRTGPDAPQSFSVRQVGDTTIVEELPPRGNGLDRPGQHAGRGGPHAPLVSWCEEALRGFWCELLTFPYLLLKRSGIALA